MNYEEVQKYLEEVQGLGIVPGLETMRELLLELGNPQDDLKFVHIAGTNGKGSVGAYLSYVLAAAGYRVGRYVSPAVFDECEKIQVLAKVPERETEEKDEGSVIKSKMGEKENCPLRKGEKTEQEDAYLCRNGKDENIQKSRIVLSYIEKNAVAAHISKIKNAVESGGMQPTRFEIETAMAFLELKEQNCDIVVLETGMGGRLDATNVIKRVECSVLTSISMDHMGFLGDTLEKIAEEKAGIIKKQVPVVSAPQTPEVCAVLQKKAEENEAELFFVKEQQAEKIVHSLHGIDFVYLPSETWDKSRFSEHRSLSGRNPLPIHLPLLGVNQIENALTALAAIQVLKGKGYALTEEAIQTGFSNTVWHGRFEVVKTRPVIIVDGAHNESAAEKLAASIRQYLWKDDVQKGDKRETFVDNFKLTENRGGKLIYVFGIFKDKEVEKVIEKTAGLADVVLTVKPDSPRGMLSGELKNRVEKFWQSIGKTGIVKDCGEVKNGIFEALKLSGEEDRIVIFGSLSLMREIKQVVLV